MNQQQPTTQVSTVSQPQFVSDIKHLSVAQADTLRRIKFPKATDNEISLVLAYCAAKKLDILLSPVHLIKYGDTTTVVPGIGLYRTIAHRSGYAGNTPPKYGETIVKHGGVESPDLCEFTVKKILKNGVIGEFTATSFFKEAFNNSPLWKKYPRAMLAKCAEANALRMAFPQEIGGDVTHEEIIGSDNTIIDHGQPQQPQQSAVGKPIVASPQSLNRDDPPDYATYQQCHALSVSCQKRKLTCADAYALIKKKGESFQNLLNADFIAMKALIINIPVAEISTDETDAAA